MRRVRVFCTAPSFNYPLLHRCARVVFSICVLHTDLLLLNMASTLSTSFSSQDGYVRGKKARLIRFKLLSSAFSDIEAVVESSDTDINTDVYRVYETVWDTFCGLPTPERPVFSLGSQAAYEGLHEKLGEHPGLLEYFENEIRKDWNSETGELRLRLMANYLHDVFQKILGLTLHEELNRIAAAHPTLQPFRQKIVPGEHGKIQKWGKVGRGRQPTFEQSPDGQLTYPGVKWPHFVFEVGYRQDEKSLRSKMTEHYEALASVCTFLTFDIDYADPAQRRVAGHFHPASVSLWTSEPDYGEDCGEEYDYDIAIRCMLDAAVFRDKDGRAMDGEVVLPFRLFIPAEERSKLPDEAATADIRISFSRLSEIVYTAERR